MAIQTTCAGCGAQLSVDGTHAGRSAQCPQCGQVYVVPNADDGSASDIPNDSESQPATGLWQLKTPEGKTYGPVNRATLDQWTTEGRVSSECMIRGDGDWCSAEQIYPELKPPPIEKGNPFAAGQETATAPGGPGFREPHRGPLILGLGIAGFLVPCPVLSTMAWFMGNTDLRKMQLGRMDTSGYSLTQAGRVFGMIFAMLWLVTLGVFFFIFICLIAMGA